MSDKPVSTTPDLRPPSAVVPDHELLRLIGRGSYGEVWLARNALGAFRAVKIVYQSAFQHRRPFEREFKGVQTFEPVSRLHEGLMDVLQVGRNEAAGYFYCVMELADDIHRGQAIDPNTYVPRTLAHDLSVHKRLPMPECRRIGAAVASALAFLHTRGLVHRDIKPSNIVFINGAPRLADIGLVAEMAEARSYVGTEGFIPPEGPGTVQADLYSLGKVLYEISTGRDRHDYPELPDHFGDPDQENELFEFHKVVVHACRTDPRERYKSAVEMAEDLEALQQGGRLRHAIARLIPSTVTRIAGIAVLVAVVGGILLWTATLRDRAPVPGVVAWWKGEKDASDSAGKNPGTLQPGMTFAAGKAGQAFVFDGFNGSVSVPPSAALDVGKHDGLTIECWIKPRDLANGYPLVVWYDHTEWLTNHLGVHFWISTGVQEGGSGCLYASFFNAGTNHYNFWSAPGIVGTNDWQHVAMTYDKATGDGRLFYNGAIVAAKKLGTFDPLSSGTLYLGKLPIDTYSGVLYRGAMDEVRIYDRALSLPEVKSIAFGHSASPEQLALMAGPIHNPANHHTYYLLSPTNWPAAEALAVRLGGHLATINDVAENSWVFDTFTPLAGPGRGLWIGLNDAAQEGDWRWVSGEPVTYLNWSPIEPNNGGKFYPDEDHVAIWHRESPYPVGSWADSPSNTLTCAIVEVTPIKPRTDGP